MEINKLLKSILLGLVASALLLTLYFVIMALAQNSFREALVQLNSLRFWVIPLVFTFGLQVGLFVYAKECSITTSKASTVTSSATSSLAMVACCAHHITDILPLIGLSVLATILTEYQPWLFVIGILSNLIGTSIMLKQLKIIKI